MWILIAVIPFGLIAILVLRWYSNRGTAGASASGSVAGDGSGGGFAGFGGQVQKAVSSIAQPIQQLFTPNTTQAPGLLPWPQNNTGQGVSLGPLLSPIFAGIGGLISKFTNAVGLTHSDQTNSESSPAFGGMTEYGTPQNTGYLGLSANDLSSGTAGLSGDFGDTGVGDLGMGSASFESPVGNDFAGNDYGGETGDLAGVTTTSPASGGGDYGGGDYGGGDYGGGDYGGGDFGGGDFGGGDF
jgi:hypothetical protein